MAATRIHHLQSSFTTRWLFKTVVVTVVVAAVVAVVAGIAAAVVADAGVVAVDANHLVER